MRMIRKSMVSAMLVFLSLSMAACGSIAGLSGSSGESSLKSDNETVESEDHTVEKYTESKEDIVSAEYEIGDIIFADGSIVKEEDLTSIDGSNVPVAVIAGFRKDGTVYGVGVHRSDTPLQWASDDEVNYPAFHFVDTYAESHDLSGEYASGWYMPGIDELCEIYQNREAVNNSLQHIYGLDDQAAMNGLETNWYWSSSESDSEDDYAWFVHYFNGYAGECPKNFTNVHVLAVHEFGVLSL